MSEIEQIRGRLEANLGALEQRLPPLVRKGKDVARLVGAVGGGTLALAVAGKVVSKVKGAPAAKTAVAAAAPQIVVRSGVGFPALVAVAAIWAGVRVYEIRMRSSVADTGARGEVRPLPGRKHA